MKCKHDGVRVHGGEPQFVSCGICGETLSDVTPRLRETIEALYVRPPPCSRCGVVEPAPAFARGRVHKCNPTHVQCMQLGEVAVISIGKAIGRWFESWSRR